MKMDGAWLKRMTTKALIESRVLRDCYDEAQEHELKRLKTSERRRAAVDRYQGRKKKEKQEIDAAMQSRELIFN